MQNAEFANLSAIFIIISLENSLKCDKNLHNSSKISLFAKENDIHQ
jgi:hypothetical protein